MSMRTTIAVASIAALAGCGGNGGGSLTIEEFGDRSPTVTCGILLDCYGQDLLESFLTTDCESQFGAMYDEAQLPRYQAAIDAGTILYHGDRAQACLDEIEAAGCGALDRVAVPSCEATLEGTIASGGACSINEECAGDAYCQTSAMTCGGTCQAQAGAGAVCDGDDACQPGLKCFDGACRTPAGAGAPCEGSDGVGCAGGLVCIGAMDAPPGGEPVAGECMAITDAQTEALGATCDIQGGPFCQPGLTCALTGVAGTTPVFECVGASSSGGTCNLGFPDPCPTGEYCDAMPFMMGGSFEGTCQALPGGGEACMDGRCAPGHTCDGTSTCRAIQHVGGACGSSSECYSGVCEGGTCVEGALCM